ncbi:MAG: ribulose-phosphate 3-epimerase [Nitrospirae bacterium]|nr:ribulose-phosphate 3-epimerase [Nitrospirota bacterium]MBF0535244.1 ribulose-phosphate 3-epimerase [Nitrospirota bacterium]MBF0615276.1 ribulose-phosphate 3-epimerase [Nitrospirota bacterium]
MILIAPSILSADFLELGREIKDTEAAGADYLHIDVMDGSFVPNITIGYFVVEQIKKVATIPLDVHLMIEKPDRYVVNFIEAGADILTIHLEAERHLHRTINWIKQQGAKAGVSINPATPLALLEDIIADVDLVLIMSVNPGFGGQKFIPGAVNKIIRLKEMLKERGLNPVIEVDGGVSPKNIKTIADAGANMVVMGSAFYTSGNYSKTISDIRTITGAK